MFSKKYNQAYVDKLASQVGSAQNTIRALEAEIRAHKDLEFELKVVKQLLNDDEAVLELLEAAENKERESKYLETRQWLRCKASRVLVGFMLAGGIGTYNQPLAAVL